MSHLTAKAIRRAARDVFVQEQHATKQGIVTHLRPIFESADQQLNRLTHRLDRLEHEAAGFRARPLLARFRWLVTGR